MSVKIDPPEKRSLNPMEQKVYDLLRDGLEPPEIAKKLHIAEKSGHCVTAYPENLPYSVMDLICGIREKGWEIPGEIFSNKNEEENNMAKGTPTPPEKVEQVLKLRADGNSLDKIAEISGVSRASAQRICKKSEPAPAATDADTDGKSLAKNSDTKIISENSGDVKSPDKKFSDYSLELIKKRICEIDREIGALNYERETLIADIKKMGGKM